MSSIPADRFWWKSSFSDGSQSCVEVATVPGEVFVRDTKDRPAGHLSVGPAAADAFVAAVAAGALDHLL